MFFIGPRHFGEGTSSAAVSQQPDQVSAPPIDISKGKEVQHSEQQVHHSEQQEIMAEWPVSTDEKSQGQDPSTQAKVMEIPVLQTPLNEERAKKRDRQEETPTGTSTDQQGEKRQRLNPFSEEEIPERPTEQQVPPSMETSASSFQQEQERQQGVEVTSTRK